MVILTRSEARGMIDFPRLVTRFVQWFNFVLPAGRTQVGLDSLSNVSTMVVWVPSGVRPIISAEKVDVGVSPNMYIATYLRRANELILYTNVSGGWSLSIQPQPTTTLMTLAL